MSRAIPPKVLRELREVVQAYDRMWHLESHRLLVAAIDRALSVKRSVKAASSRRSQKKATKREKTAAVREAVMARAGCGVVCECGCGRQANSLFRLQMDHFRGGANKRSNETVEGCWALHPWCHARKTNGQPSRLAWLQSFREHCLRHGYTKEARETERLIDFASTKEAFGVAR